jgi:hypothetical protein
MVPVAFVDPRLDGLVSYFLFAFPLDKKQTPSYSVHSNLPAPLDRSQVLWIFSAATDP